MVSLANLHYTRPVVDPEVNHCHMLVVRLLSSVSSQCNTISGSIIVGIPARQEINKQQSLEASVS